MILLCMSKLVVSEVLPAPNFGHEWKEASFPRQMRSFKCKVAACGDPGALLNTWCKKLTGCSETRK
jgi:hypothetical protein